MNTFDLNLGGVNIAITGNSENEIIETLEEHGLSELITNNFYFSKTTEQKTGNGWISLANMNEAFLVNAFAARLSESVRGIYKDISTDYDEYDCGVTHSLYTSFLDGLVDVLERAFLDDPNNNVPILRGLALELDRRINTVENNEFDESDEDVLLSSCCNQSNHTIYNVSLQ